MIAKMNYAKLVRARKSPWIETGKIFSFCGEVAIRARKSPWIETFYLRSSALLSVRARKSPWIETVYMPYRTYSISSGLVRARGLKRRGFRVRQ